MHRVAGFALVGMFAPALLHCDGSATGIDACRSIEEKKCILVKGCPGSTVQTDADVDACKLFYRDQCLHGIADFAKPDDAAVATCLAALDAAGACRDGTLATCSGAPELTPGSDATKMTGCAAVLASEVLVGCSFLAKSPATSGGGGAGGATASGGGGAGGT
ncbi:MAG: hypothetical protein FJ096_10310 [Deltaproteobacteria bacterium]|nr:hypothetical protein [Deltaproteobacteria bacterium]